MWTALGLGVLAMSCIGIIVIRRRRRSRDRRSMYVTSVPGIELDQPYGGWDAEASTTAEGRVLPPVRFIETPGPPSTWGRIP